MDYRSKILTGLVCTVLLTVFSIQLPVFAKASSVTAESGKQKYIVLLEDLPLAAYDGRAMHTPERGSASTRLPATANRFTGARKLDVRSPGSKKYLKFLDERFEAFRGEARLKMGRQLKPTHRYRHALNGFATSLSETELGIMREFPGVKAVFRDEVHHLHTDSGPAWVGADKIHDGLAGFSATGGEDVVIGIIDSGINWDHYAFTDPGEGLPPGGAWDHVNPYDEQLGLCSKAEVLCNDKLVGVFDFVEDNPDTDEVEEENNGKDNSGHGSHVASIAAGNPDSVFLNGVPAQISGVAPNANIISYRVCYIGDPLDDSDDGCDTSAIFSAIERAIEDQVDVVNYSIGTTIQSPWDSFSPNLAFLNLRAAGIFVATSAGNEGPNAGSIGSPANVPWITSVGNATHDRVFGNALENMGGGDTIPPPYLIGTSFTDGVSTRKIVRARDIGNALCGTGVPESGATCAENTGATNPFAPGTFNGEIVVCERGDYGRVEKGKNVLLAGAGGYVLINTEEWGEGIVTDDHCLPATHLGYGDGQVLNSWLKSGDNHQASISDFSIFHIPEAGDVIAGSSSRGPNQPPVEDILKPDVIAPGTLIVGAGSVDTSYAILTGTSMSSPNVAGGGALLKSVHPLWSPSMIASALLMTATPELAVDLDGTAATPHKTGNGRPRLDQAVNAGLYLNETESGFLAANPALGGKPKDLNLPGLVDTVCRGSCSFTRTVTDLVGGATWNASFEGLDDAISASVSPASFSLSNGASRQLTIDLDLSQADVVGSWVYGTLRLTSSGRPDSVFILAVFADGGELPPVWEINSDSVSGWQKFTLDGLSNMPDATYTSGGLVVPTLTIESLPEDPTNDDPYEGSVGRMTIWHDVPADALWLHAEVLSTTAIDMDIYVGRDTNGDDIAQESEELCAGVSSDELDFCDLFTPEEGSYWIIVQNWAASNASDEVLFESAVVAPTDFSSLVASGNGIVPEGENHEIRLSWDNVNHAPGTKLIGAVGIGTGRDRPSSVGIIPVSFTKTGTAAPETLVLMNGIERGLTIEGNDQHDLSYIDVPPGVSSLTISASAADGEQGENLQIDLYRQEFDDAFSDAPFAKQPDISGLPLATATGSGATGPEVVVSGGVVVPGRWFAVLKNRRNVDTAIKIKAIVTSAGDTIPLRGGLWQPSSRPGLSQGYDFNYSGGSRALIWYTYDEDGNPVWYLAADIDQVGNIWVSELRRFTNDGTLQQSEKVGSVSVTTLAEKDEIFSFVLFGDEGSDRMFPNSDPICPTINNVEQSYTGLWSRPAIGVGGASALVNATSQGYLHYVYDDRGRPIWLLGADASGSATVREMILTQWNGYCAVCTGNAPGFVDAGMLTRDFVDEDNMSWNLDYVLQSPLSGSADRTDDAVKLTRRLSCQ